MASQQRLLSRKWFASSEAYQGSLRVPGFVISSSYTSPEFKEIGDESVVTGLWSYNPDLRANVQHA
jgi:hypothetical protein